MVIVWVRKSKLRLSSLGEISATQEKWLRLVRSMWQFKPSLQVQTLRRKIICNICGYEHAPDRKRCPATWGKVCSEGSTRRITLPGDVKRTPGPFMQMTAVKSLKKLVWLVMWNSTKVKLMGMYALPVGNLRNNSNSKVRFLVVEEHLTPLGMLPRRWVQRKIHGGA